MALQIIDNVDKIRTTSEQWWVVFNASTNTLETDPLHGDAYVTTPNALLIADSEDEILTYIQENNLTPPNEDYDLELP